MWEEILIDAKGNDSTAMFSHRLKVPGGWILQTIVSRYHGGASVEQTFVADPAHQWEIEKAPEEKQST